MDSKLKNQTYKQKLNLIKNKQYNNNNNNKKGLIKAFKNRVRKITR